VTGSVIGMSRFHGYDAEKSEVEIGWTFLARAYWGGTYNRELKSLMLRHALRRVRRVVFLVSPQKHPFSARGREARRRPRRVAARCLRSQEHRLRTRGVEVRLLDRPSRRAIIARSQTRLHRSSRFALRPDLVTAPSIIRSSPPAQATRGTPRRRLAWVRFLPRRRRVTSLNLRAHNP
jgi:Acetyltransferase (GNAT) domain